MYTSSSYTDIVTKRLILIVSKGHVLSVSMVYINVTYISADSY